MTKSREQAIEAAKAMVSLKFDISSQAMGMMRGGSGNIYEAKASKDVKNNLVEFSGKYCGMDSETKTISIELEEETVSLIPIKETVYSRSIVGAKIPRGEMLYVIAVRAENHPVYVPVVIIRDEEKQNFMMVKSLFGRANAIKTFYKLESAKQEAILSQLGTNHYNRFESDEDIVFQTRQELVLKYALTKETYTPDTQRAIEGMFKDKETSKHKVDQRLQYLFRIASSCEKRIPVKAEPFEKKLNEKFYKMDKAKKQIKDLFCSIERAEKKGCNVLFVGEPGVGKTSLMMAIAEAMNLPFECIPMNGLSCPLEIEGLDPGYDSADAGAIVKAFAAHGTSQMVLCLDEFDKMNRSSKEGDPMNVFLRVFLGDHYDKFLQCIVKTDNTIFIATANSVENIPEAIMNRFNAVIYLDDYSCDDKCEIAKRFLIPDVLRNYNIEATNVVFTDEAIHCIIMRYCEDDGARDLKHNIERIVSRIIGDGNADVKNEITPEYVDSVLAELIEETPALYFGRNREHYSVPVAKEIKKCIRATKKSSNSDTDRFDTEKKRQKLDYLLACRTEAKTFLDKFDPKYLESELHKSLFGMNKVIKEVTNIYFTAYLQGNSLNSNLALCGGYGIGKTSIVENIAKAMDYRYVKISLNGIADIKELRGFSSTYIGSEPGRIMKGYKEAGSLRTVVQLDEIDKLKPEFADVLLDLLDREFTDNFVDVPVDLRQSIFVATANDWAKVAPVVRDRFIVIDVDGYSRSEKSQIVSDYIIPKLEKCYAASGVSIVIDDEAEDFLLKTYATSFGVRDAEKAMQRICSSKLVDQVGAIDAVNVRINKDDVCKYLGEIPIPRGNFPEDGTIPGISKALAVSNGNMGSSFAIETVLIDGDESLEMTGLPKETATDSVKIAVTCIKKMYPNLLKGKHIHVHFGEGSVPKDGPSAGVALLMSILSAAINKPIMNEKPYDIAYTGKISLTGGVFAIGGTMEKIQAAYDSGCSKVFIPMQNYEHLDKEKLKEFDCEVIPVTHVSQVIKSVFPDLD